MENHIEFVDNPVDIELSQPTKSKFLFYFQHNLFKKKRK